MATEDGGVRACAVPGCGRPHYAHGLCNGHNRRARVGYPIDAPMRTWKRRPPNSKREFMSWQSMKMRCRYPGASGYEYYGGRGIAVCERWLGPDGFNNFYADMGPRPAGTQLDRIDPNGNYEPGNCRWTTNRQQIRNRRNTLWATIGGQTKPMATWAEELGISRHTLARRRRDGWSDERILSSPIGSRA